jgi:KDO2-lipid IV(A) lauroyltransferase
VSLATAVAEAVLPRLPRAADGAIGALAGAFASRAAPGARAAVLANLRIITPDADPEPLMRAIFGWQARHYVEIYRFSRMSHDEVRATVDAPGWDNFAAAVGRKDGVVLASAHLGPVSVCGQIVVARGISVTTPIEPETGEVARSINRARSATGIRFVPVDAPIGLRRVLREGGVLAILADRAVTGVGVRVPFFGRDALLPSAAVALALRSGAALVPAFAERSGSRYVARFGEEIPLPRSGDHDADVREGVAHFASVLEAAIRRNVAEWSVFEPIWER